MDKCLKNFDNTIVAITTALGEGAVGVIRLSGPEAFRIVSGLFRKKHFAPLDPVPRVMQYGYVYDGDEPVDEVLAVYMPAPHSYTAEDVIEIQCHGGPAVLERILALCLKSGACMAEPGEFTKRAFLNGRIDLTQAEAVMDLIKAKSATAAGMALRAQRGELGAKLRKLRTGLLDLIVQLEAKIDYPEDDIEDVTYDETAAVLQESLTGVQRLLATGHTGRILREGLRTAIVGRPNVGKSSLLNALLHEERAIVSEYAGTTRDVIEEQLLLGGVPLVLIDTAGIRQTEDFVEKIGVERSRAALAEAQLILCVLDGSMPLQPEDEALLQSLPDKPVAILVNKADLPLQLAMTTLGNYGKVLQVSSKTGSGLDALQKFLRDFVYQDKGAGEGLYVQNLRHLELLQGAEKSLKSALDGVKNQMPYDCVIIDVRQAVHGLGMITGDAVEDEVLNKIFEKFCLGK